MDLGSNLVARVITAITPAQKIPPDSLAGVLTGISLAWHQHTLPHGGSRHGSPLLTAYSLSLGQRSEEHGGHCGLAVLGKVSPSKQILVPYLEPPAGHR